MRPTIKELIAPEGMTIEEMNGKPNPNDPDLLDIQVQFLGNYHEEAKRRALEEDVRRREVELEMMKEKQRIVSGLDNADLNALIRTFDKVSAGSIQREDDLPRYALTSASARCARLPAAL